jgi:hypothetical protein
VKVNKTANIQTSLESFVKVIGTIHSGVYEPPVDEKKPGTPKIPKTKAINKRKEKKEQAEKKRKSKEHQEMIESFTKTAIANILAVT